MFVRDVVPLAFDSRPWLALRSAGRDICSRWPTPPNWPGPWRSGWPVP